MEVQCTSCTVYDSNVHLWDHVTDKKISSHRESGTETTLLHSPTLPLYPVHAGNTWSTSQE